MNYHQFFKTVRIIVGVIIMLGAFSILPKETPWYFEVLLFNLGFAIAFLPKLKEMLLKMRSKTTLLGLLTFSAGYFF